MTNKEKTIKELKEALDSLDITNKYRLNLIRAIEYLQEEPVSDDLEKAANDWNEKASFNPFYMVMNGDKPIDVKQDITTHADSFKAGAKWQKEQDKETIELAEDHAMLAGMEKMKEQMMAIGVDGVVHHLEKCKVASVHYNDPTGVPMAYYFTSTEGLSAGDKVKIIVIKEK